MKLLYSVIATTVMGFCLCAPTLARPHSLWDRPGTTAFGTGGAGIAKINSVLEGSTASRSDKEKALNALTFYGKDGVEALLSFTKQSKGNTTWNRGVARATCSIIDRRLVPSLIRLTEEKSDPVIQENALIALASLVEWTPLVVEVPGHPGSRSAVCYIGGSTMGSAHSVGLLLQSDDFDVIRQAALNSLSMPDADPSVQHAANYLSSLLTTRQTRKSKPQFQSSAK
jgi:hypothetical protein